MKNFLINYIAFTALLIISELVYGGVSDGIPIGRIIGHNITGIVLATIVHYGNKKKSSD